MSSGVKLTMYLSYYDPKKELAVEPIEISKPVLSPLNELKHEHISKTGSLAAPNDAEII